MNKINGLPKTAYMFVGGINLKVENHRVQSEKCLLHWLIYIVNWPDNHKNTSWEKIHSEMISQGLKFDAVREQCIEDLKDPKNLAKIFFVINFDHTISMHELVEFSKTKHAKRGLNRN